jgi:CRISPR/Cas system-associated protein Cas5 (RAMP superfamily)
VFFKTTGVVNATSEEKKGIRIKAKAIFLNTYQQELCKWDYLIGNFEQSQYKLFNRYFAQICA